MQSQLKLCYHFPITRAAPLPDHFPKSLSYKTQTSSPLVLKTFAKEQVADLLHCTYIILISCVCLGFQIYKSSNRIKMRFTVFLATLLTLHRQ